MMSSVKRKNIISLLLCLAILLGLTPLSINSLAAKSPASYTIIHNEVLSIPIGNDIGQVGYFFGEAPLQIRGPGSFYVHEDGWISILDSENNRILIFENEVCIDTILLPEKCYATQMCFMNNAFYVLNYTYDNVYEVPYSPSSPTTVSADSYRKFDLPNGLSGGLICEILATPYGVAVSDADDCYYYLSQDNRFSAGNSYWQYLTPFPNEVNECDHTKQHDNNIVSIRQNSSKWNVSLDKGSDTVTAIGSDSEKNLYVNYYDYVVNVYSIYFEETVRKVDASGNVVGYARIDNEGMHTYANTKFQTMSDGTVYYLACYEDKVSVQKLIFSRFCNSKKAQIAKLALKADAELLATEEEKAAASNKIFADNYSKAQVENRALIMANKIWRVESHHKNEPSDVQLPKYVADASVGSNVKGIPYCIGGYNGINDNSSVVGSDRGKPFDTAITADNAIAGNTKPGNWVSPTVGLDCSGFVSSAYGLPTYCNTEKINNDVGHEIESAQTSQINMQKMDVLVKCETGDNHTFIFIAPAAGGKYTIIDSTTASTGGGIHENRRIDKVSRRTVGPNYFTDYMIKRMWHVIKFEYNATHHRSWCLYNDEGKQCDLMTTKFVLHQWVAVNSIGYELYPKSVTYTCICGATK